MATTWDPDNKQTSITLSNGDLTATNSAGTSVRNVIATVGYDVTSSIGRGIQFVSAVDSSSMRLGLAVNTHTLTLAIGATGETGYAVVMGSTSFRGPNNGVVTGQTSLSVGTKVLFLFKSGAIYCYWDNAGTWTAMKTGVDANAGTGGVWTGLTGTLYPIGQCQAAGSQITIQPAPDNMEQFPSYLGWDQVAGGGLLRRPITFDGGMQDLFNGGFQQ